jgi:hypothetical protein
LLPIPEAETPTIGTSRSSCRIRLVGSRAPHVYFQDMGAPTQFICRPRTAPELGGLPERVVGSLFERDVGRLPFEPVFQDGRELGEGAAVAPQVPDEALTQDLVARPERVTFVRTDST